MQARLIAHLTCFVAMLASSAACGDDPADVVVGDTMSALVDGAAWSAERTVQLINNETVVVVGTGAAFVGVGITFPDDGPGTYITGPGSSATGSVIAGATQWTADAFGGTGTITVTRLDATGTSGTFSFTAPLSMGSGSPGTREVTNGVFDVSFPSGP